MRKHIYLGSKCKAKTTKTKSLLNPGLLPVISVTKNSAAFFSLHGGER